MKKIRICAEYDFDPNYVEYLEENIKTAEQALERDKAAVKRGDLHITDLVHFEWSIVEETNCDPEKMGCS